MTCCLPLALSVSFLFSQSGFGQSPAVHVKVKESSGFLGLGGPRIVEFRLSNQNRTLPLNSVNVNAGSFVYFDCVPAGDWQFDDGFVNEYLSAVTVEQNNLVLRAAFTGKIDVTGDTTHVLLGYPKTLRVEQPFGVSCETGDTKNEVVFRVPEEYWPGYESLDELMVRAEQALSRNQYRSAISLYNEIIANNAFSIFSHQRTAGASLLSTFDAYLTSQLSAAYALRDSTQLDLKERIAGIAGYRPAFAYVIDSLPQVPFEIPPLDSAVSALRRRARTAALMVGSTADSLQTILDEQTVRWILRGSVTGRRGLQYQEMVQALAYAFASADFADTLAPGIAVTLPAWIQSRLVKDTLLDAYQTFVRICSERHQMRLTLFPVEFLPNLRKDSVSFGLPYYSMLKAVGEYYSGNYTSCTSELAAVFRSCYAEDLIARFDTLRLAIAWRQGRGSPNAFATIRDAQRLESGNDVAGAGEKYRQAVAVAPGFAFASFALGEFCLRSADTARALNAFEQSYQSDTAYLSAYKRCAQLWMQQKRYRSAIDVLTLALARGNDFWLTNSMLGQAFMVVGDAPSAEARYERALELNPRCYDTYIALGKAYQASKDFQKARDYFNRAIEIDALRREAVDALNTLNEQQLNAH